MRGWNATGMWGGRDSGREEDVDRRTNTMEK